MSGGLAVQRRIVGHPERELQPLPRSSNSVIKESDKKKDWNETSDQSSVTSEQSKTEIRGQKTVSRDQ